MSAEVEDSSGWSSSDEELEDSYIRNNKEISASDIKQPVAQRSEQQSDGLNTAALRIPREHKISNDESDDSQESSVSEENDPEGDNAKNCYDEPGPKRLKTGYARTAESIKLHGQVNSPVRQVTGISSSNAECEISQTQGTQEKASNNGSKTPITQTRHSDRNNSAPPASIDRESEAEGDSDAESCQTPVKLPPAFVLGARGAKAHVDVNAAERMPLFFTDVKELVAFSGAGNDHSPIPGIWWQLSLQPRVPQTVCLLIEGLALDDFTSHRDCFPELDKIFSAKLEVITPAAYDGSFIEELTLVPMSRGKQKGLLMNYSCLEGALLRHNNLYGYREVLVRDLPGIPRHRATKEDQDRAARHRENHKYRRFLEVMKRRRARNIADERRDAGVVMKSLTKKKVHKRILPDAGFDAKMLLANLPPQDRFPRTQLVMNRVQQVAEGVPTPLGGCFADRYGDYIPTKDLYAPITAHSPMFAVDCEMVQTTGGEGILELARVSIVDEDLKCIYDELVKPDNRVTNHLTVYSGVTAKHLADVTKRLGDVHRDLRALLPMDAILVGHSICNDLHALRMVHPYLIDTSVIFNVADHSRRKAKLATLSQLLLDETIQAGHGHCPTEDSRACMKLVQLKLSKDIEFGDTMMQTNSAAWINNPKVNLQKSADSVEWEEFPLSSRRRGFATVWEMEGSRVVVGEKLSRQTHKLDLTQPIQPGIRKEWMFEMMLADPLFGLLKFVGKSAALVGTPDLIKQHEQWRPEVQRKLDHFVKVVTATDTRDVFEQVAKTLRYEFVVGHAHFAAKVVENAKPDEKKMIFSAIDAACKKIWDAMVDDGLCVIVFGGRERGTNGMCFVRLKNDVKEVAKKKPKTGKRKKGGKRSVS